MTNAFETIEKIANLYKSGLTGEEIAKMYGVTKQAVYYHLKSAHIRIRKNKFSASAQASAKINHVRGKNHPMFRNLPDKKIEIAYLSGQTTSAIGDTYNVSAATICRHLKINGVKMRQPGFGTWQIAKDGHKVQSFFELIVDDWLFDHQIKHISQPPLPFSRNSRADFLIGNTYIEVMGLISSSIYKQKYVLKLDLYKEHGLNVVCIFPSHLRNNCKILETLNPLNSIK